MLTLREYLEQEARNYSSLSQDEHSGSHRHWWFAGHAKMCRNMLNHLDDETLNTPVEFKEVK